MRIIDEMFAVWLARVEELVGCKVDRDSARAAFECYDIGTTPLSPEEFAEEFNRGRAARRIASA
jgi:hypothetical protein